MPAAALVHPVPLVRPLLAGISRRSLRRGRSGVERSGEEGRGEERSGEERSGVQRSLWPGILRTRAGPASSMPPSTAKEATASPTGHTYMHARMHACMHAYVHAYMRTCIHAYRRRRRPRLGYVRVSVAAVTKRNSAEAHSACVCACA